MKSSRTHLRNLAVTLAVLLAALLVALPPATPSVQAQQLATLQQTNAPLGSFDPGAVVRINFTLTVAAQANDTYNFTIAANNPPSGAIASTPGTIQVTAGSNQSFSIDLSTPATISPGTYNVQFTATGLRIGSTGPTPLTTSSIVTFTIRGTVPTTPTPTPTPVPGCPEIGPNDPGNDFGGARLILVDILNKHGICTIGDEDWFRFAAIGGKVYTIDIPQMDDGLDLALELYDDQQRVIANNDDFYDRDPAKKDPTDIRPQIKSWRAPFDGIYRIRVRDTGKIGGSNKTYSLIVNTEGRGPTPVAVAEICRDLYEDDGLPEQARLILSNERHPNRAICPAGDADWVRFFGKAGKLYYLYTDTRPYNGTSPLNQSQAGADTVLFLVDRDGLRVIDFNDDIPNGNTLDSQVSFTPPVDGFYYAQIKNTGDIGNQFLRYDLILELCLPKADCGRTPQGSGGTGGGSGGGGGAATPQPTQAPAATPPPQAGAPTPTAVSFIEETPTPQALFTTNDQNSGLINGPIQSFADPSFGLVWVRSDQPIAAGRVQRGWLWGPAPLMARGEAFSESPGGMRQVQYFDKGRMEVNDRGANRRDPWFVTSGLLTLELVTGQMQIGLQEFVVRAPAQLPLAGDADDPDAPLYASLSGLLAPAPDRTGRTVRETLDRNGVVGSSLLDLPETRLVQYIPETGHNLPAVFRDALLARGLIADGTAYRTEQLFDWVFTLGYPISEPYWVRVRIGGVERDVLVQAFQRRVLTYTPDNPAGWRVEMGNVGRHYYQWRYNEVLP